MHSCPHRGLDPLPSGQTMWRRRCFRSDWREEKGVAICRITALSPSAPSLLLLPLPPLLPSLYHPGWQSDWEWHGSSGYCCHARRSLITQKPRPFLVPWPDRLTPCQNRVGFPWEIPSCPWISCVLGDCGGQSALLLRRETQRWVGER